MYLAGSMFLIYLAHIIVLSPFFPTEIQKISPYLYILFMYMIYIYTRIIFILPAASNNISKSLKESYVLTKGNSIRIYFMYVLILFLIYSST